jgi:hypothetical protein
MNFKSFSWQFLSLVLFMQPSLFSMAATSPALGYARTGTGYAAKGLKSLKPDSTFGSNLWSQMSQGSPKAVEIPQTKVNPKMLQAAVQSTALVPVKSSMMLSQFNPDMLTFSPYASIPMFPRSALRPQLGVDILHEIREKVSSMRLHTDIDDLALLNRSYQKLVDTLKFEKNYDPETVEAMQDLKKYVEMLMDFTRKNIEFEERSRLREQSRENAQRTAYAKADGTFIPAEEGQIPVENPYQEFKQDARGQFWSGAKLGAAGAGTVYALKNKYDQRQQNQYMEAARPRSFLKTVAAEYGK